MSLSVLPNYDTCFINSVSEMNSKCKICQSWWMHRMWGLKTDIQTNPQVCINFCSFQNQKRKLVENELQQWAYLKFFFSIASQDLGLQPHLDPFEFPFSWHTCHRRQCFVGTKPLASHHMHQVGLFVTQKRD